MINYDHDNNNYNDDDEEEENVDTNVSLLMNEYSKIKSLKFTYKLIMCSFD